MADTTKIGDIAKQMTKASRVIVSTDGFWVQTGDGQSVQVPAEFVRAYLGAAIMPSISETGTWKVGDTDLGIKAAGSISWAYFYRMGNKLYLHDDSTSMIDHVKKVGNKLIVTAEG